MRNVKLITFRFQLAMATLLLIPSFLSTLSAQAIDEAAAIINSPLVFINPYIENGSRFNWTIGKDSVLYIQQVYDYERSAKNRTAEHWHFLLEAKAGSELTIVLKSFGEIYNGHIETMPSYMSCVVSEDGKKWRHIPTEWIETPQGPNLKMQVHMESDSLYLARVDPYRVSDLQNLFSKIRGQDRIQIIPIGKSVQARELHIIRVGNENAPHKVFIRGRVHPWEPGGNWVIEGLIETLLQDSEEVSAYLENYCLYILPMANIDGVTNGVTRFNMMGLDLNRNLTTPADPVLAPENLAMELWLEDMITKGMNDGKYSPADARAAVNQVAAMEKAPFTTPNYKIAEEKIFLTLVGGAKENLGALDNTPETKLNALNMLSAMHDAMEKEGAGFDAVKWVDDHMYTYATESYNEAVTSLNKNVAAGFLIKKGNRVDVVATRAKVEESYRKGHMTREKADHIDKLLKDAERNTVDPGDKGNY